MAKTMVQDAINEADAAAADKIDLFVIGLLGGAGATFANELDRNRGTTVTFTDPTQIAAAFQAIPSQIPLSIVH
jgi:hypothetical protein